MFRLVANIHGARLLSHEFVGKVLDIAKMTEHFELDRGENNPPACDFCIEKSTSLTALYAECRDSLLASYGGTAIGNSGTIQPPFLVRYNASERPSLQTHCDNSKWTSVIFLNDDFVGGELEFPSLGCSIKPQPGYCVLFPGGDLYPHFSNPVLSGTKYALVTMAS